MDLSHSRPERSKRNSSTLTNFDGQLNDWATLSLAMDLLQADMGIRHQRKRIVNRRQLPVVAYRENRNSVTQKIIPEPASYHRSFVHHDQLGLDLAAPAPLDQATAFVGNGFVD